MLHRGRLTRAIVTARPIALIVAPAGCGKSTALQHAMESLDDERLTTVAIDDIHLAAADTSLAYALAETIERSVSTTRWLLAGRGVGSLPVEKWIEGGLATVAAGARDLAFTLEEALALTETLEAQVAAADVEPLWSNTSGWAAGIAMALRFRPHCDDVFSAMKATRDVVHRYVAEQVFDSLDERERRLLALAAVMPDVDVTALEAAGFQDASRVLEDLCRRLSILEPMSEPKRYRYWNVARDLMLHNAHADAYAQAARGLEASGRGAEALMLFARDRRTPDIVRLIELHAYDLVMEGRSDGVKLALDSLDIRDASHPAVLCARAHLAYHDSRYHDAMMLADRALAAGVSPELHAKITLVWSLAALMGARNPVERLESVLGEDPTLPASLLAELQSVLLLAYSIHECAHDVGPISARVAAFVDDSRLNGATSARVCARMARAHKNLGRMAQATAAFERAVTIAVRAGAYRELTIAYEGLAQMANQEGAIAEELRYSVLAGEAARKSGDTFHAIGPLRREVTAYFIAGNREGLDRAIERLEDLIPAGTTDLALLLGKATRAAWDGDFEAALKFHQQADYTGLLWESRMLIYARSALYCAAAGNADAAADAIRLTTGTLSSTDWSRPSCTRYHEMSIALCAVALIITGDRAYARRMLRSIGPGRSVGGAALLAIAASLLDDVTSDGPLVSQFAVMEEHWFGGYAKLIRAVLPKLRSLPHNAEGLAPSELEVLKLLAAGATPKSVALERGCSINTVRKHIAHIARKLECNGYRQAVRIARERGYVVTSASGSRQSSAGNFPGTSTTART